MGARISLIAAAMIAVAAAAASAAAADTPELSIETILAQHSELNGKIVRFRGMLVLGGMTNQGLCSNYTPPLKCLWFGGSRLFSDVQKREPEAKRFIVEGRFNDKCIRQECTDVFSQIEDAVIIGQY